MQRPTERIYEKAIAHLKARQAAMAEHRPHGAGLRRRQWTTRKQEVRND